ncbi:MAG: hypothetical protein HOK41_05560, partial [Nitrospina sp.]|nr:hypothetical protein [Nitrospina sp.]
TGTALTDYLKASDYDCLRFLGTYSTGVGLVYSDANMLTALNELTTLAPSYQANNDLGVLGLMFFVHFGFFHNFYDSIQLGSSIEPALLTTSASLIANVKFTDYLNNDDAAEFLNEWTQTIDAANLAGSYIPTFTEILQRFEDYFEQFSTVPDFGQRNTQYGVLFSISRAQSHDLAGKLTQDLIDRLEYLAANSTIPDTYDYISINGIWDLGLLLGHHPAMDTAIVTALTNALDAQPRLSLRWTWVVKALDQFNNCETSRPGESVCFAELKDEILTDLLPYNYYFDDGALVIKTSLDYDTIQTLYHAIKEVQGQFNRITETITPLTNDPNGVLTMIVYGSREDYEDYQPLLFNLGTSNGGIYIEGDGTFFTYQRTTQESTFTLEELLRHEFVHYLAGRFTINGIFGQTPFYSNSRLTWFDEGLAEFLTGSNNQNIKIREHMVRRTRLSNIRMSVSEILSASYGNFTFYSFASLFFNYLYEHDISTLRQVFRLIRESDLEGYDALISQMKNDANLETAYQTYLDEQLAKTLLTNPVTDEPILEELDSNDIAAIETEFRKTRLGYSSDCSVASSQLNPRFSCRGVLTGPASNHSDESLAWRHFDKSLNEGIIREAVRKSTLNNLHYLNCRLGPINFLENNAGKTYPRANFYCDGPLAAGTYTIPNRVDRANSDFQRSRLGKTASCQSVNNDEIECAMTLSLKEQDEVVPDETQANTQLQQVTADFKSTRLGVHATCLLSNNDSKVDCEMGATTIAFLESDHDQDIYDFLDATLVNLKNDVVNLNSVYYAGLRCDFIDGTTQIAHFTSGGVDQKYGLGRVRCSISTSQYPELQEKFNKDLVKLKNQVYAVQPPFYRDLLCSFNGSTRVIPRPNNKVNAVRDVTCGIPANDDPLPVSNFFRINPQANVQLGQVLADFHSTRFGLYAACELTNNYSTISCERGLSTFVFLESDPDQDVYDNLNANLVTLHNDVAIINPDFYSGLSCEFIDGSLRILHRVRNGVDEKFGNGQALCTVDVQ